MAPPSSPQQEANNNAYDIIVVGNGVLGLSLALTLARRKLKVALLGAPQRPWAASTAAGAMLGCFGEVTAPLLKSEFGRAKLDLAVRSTKLWEGWLAALDEDVEPGNSKVITAQGTVVILNTIGAPGIDDANFTAMREALALYQEPFEDLDPANLEWLDPVPTSRPLRALFLPNEHAVNTPVLLERLERAFVHRGGTLISEAAVRLEQGEQQIDGLVLASGARIKARNVVLASGARSQALLNTLPAVAAQIPPLCAGMGVSVLLRGPRLPTPRSVMRTTNRAFACGLHMVPRQQGEIYVGATNIIEPEACDTPVVRDLMFLLECATRQLRKDLWEVGAHKVQIGNRPVALDGYPLLGQTGLSGLWMMTGTYRDGLHLSPLLAEEIARRILGEKTDINLDKFKPVRAPIQSMSREEIIETAVMHMLATGYESNWVISNEWPRFIESGLRTAYVKFAAELDERYTPPPEIFAKARVTPQLVTMLRNFYAASRANQ